MIENNNEEAGEVLHFIIQKRTRELQRKDPEVDITDALKSIIMSLIREGVDFEKLQESKNRTYTTSKESKGQEKEDSEFDVWIEDVIQKFMIEERVSDDINPNGNTKQPEDDGEELLFFKTPKDGCDERNPTKRSISIKVITLIENDKVPIKVEDSPDNKDQSTEEDRDIEPQEERSTVTLRPKESRKIPVLKPNMFKKTTSKQNPEMTEKKCKGKS